MSRWLDRSRAGGTVMAGGGLETTYNIGGSATHEVLVIGLPFRTKKEAGTQRTTTG